MGSGCSWENSIVSSSSGGETVLRIVSSFWTIFYSVIVFVVSHSIVTNNLGWCQHHSDLLFFLLTLFIIRSFPLALYKNLVLLLFLFFLSLSLSLFLSLSLPLIFCLHWYDASHPRTSLGELYNVWSICFTTSNYFVLFFLPQLTLISNSAPPSFLSFWI